MEIEGESSSSSNGAIQKVAISEATKDEEPENKKLKQDESGNPEGTQNEPSINDLPAEMLVKILKHVDDKTLVACRLVSRAWRDISTEILCTRGEMELQFTFDEDEKDFKQVINDDIEERSLGDFVECFKESKNCFYSRFLFRFNLLPSPSKFQNEDWLQFFSYIKDHIKCLKLVVSPNGSASIEDLRDNLNDLLLKKLPQLEEFGLNFTSQQVFNSQVQLFPSKSTTETTSTTATKTTEITITTKTTTLLPSVQLPHLKILHLSEVLFSTCPRFVDGLLKAAVNLKSIRDFAEHPVKGKKYLKIEDYVFLHSRGKLDLLEEAEMTPSVELFSAFEGKTRAFKLKKLELCMSTIYKEEENWEDASNFISELFENNKDTLKELTMDPVGFLPDVNFPRFSKLETLLVNSTNDSEIFEPCFPSGINSMDIFPVLRTLELDMDWTKNFPGEMHIPRIPTVESLIVSDWKITESSIVKMISICPNLKDFTINSVYDEEYNVNFPEVARAIWTHMKKLESLDLKIDLKSDFNTSHALDSCFTGFSVKNCKRLFELKKAQKYLKRWKSQSKVAKSEFKTPEREHVSILDLKDLKSLDVKVEWYLGDRTSAENVLKRALTCVSEIYAFKLMKNLNYSIDKDIDY